MNKSQLFASMGISNTGTGIKKDASVERKKNASLEEMSLKLATDSK